MSGMMNAKRYTGCRCCVDPDDVARRQIEKREAEAEIAEELEERMNSDYVKGVLEGRDYERGRIIAEINDAPIAFDFFAPYISRTKLLEILEGEGSE